MSAVEAESINVGKTQLNHKSHMKGANVLDEGSKRDVERYEMRELRN